MPNRSQRHKIAVQGYDSSGDTYEQGAVGDSVKAPTLASLSPNTGVHGAAAQTVTATGTNFVAPMSVLWGSVGLAAVVTSPTTLTFQAPLPSASAGTVAVKVVKATYQSGSQNYTVT